ncbi:MAG: hypothetical protein ACYTEE_01530 [Planctomycetota bacterium]|jgi:hypothetical protein
MSLMKWFRKNNKKIMAIVVIILLVGFLGGSYFSRLAQRRSGINQTIATLANGKEIKSYDIVFARQELEILKMLGIDVMLKSNINNLHFFLLGELLFPERTFSSLLMNRVKQRIRNSGLTITDKQLNDIFQAGTPRDLLWLLLTIEAKQAGIRIPNERAGAQLAQVIPQLSNNLDYRQVMSSIIQRNSVSEEQIISTFGKVLAVVVYAMETCTNESLTSSQLGRMTSYQQETVNTELVEFAANLFVDEENEPSEEILAEHFEEYKSFVPGIITPENPFGFGYKLPDMAKLEYLAVKIDDISGIVSEPGPEEIEDYYQRHRQEYIVSVPSDPNDPNSTKIPRQKTYAEVANLISEQLLQKNINSKADEIIQQAKTLTESGFEQADIDLLTASSEQIKEYAGDYEQAAEKLNEQHQIPIYRGQTGLLSFYEMMNDRYLGMMPISGQALNIIPLTQAVFAIDELQVNELGLYDIAKPKMYQNIGPAQDFTGQVVALLRIVEAQKAKEPDSIDLAIDKSTIVLDQEEEKISSVKEKVTQDVKKLTAFDVAETKASEFKQRLQTEQWDNAISDFNKLYKTEKGLPESDPNMFTLQNLTNLRRIPQAAIDALNELDSPTNQVLIETYLNKKFVDKLYELVPPEQDSLSEAPVLMESKSRMSWYVVKNISINRLYQEDYLKLKGQASYQEDYFESQNLAAIHFNPGNILKRMNFPITTVPEQPEDANTPGEPSSRI